MNLVYRLRTNAGEWAIKALVRELDDLTDERFEIELGAFAGGIPMPRPVPPVGGGPVAHLVSGERVRCFTWEEGDVSRNEATSPGDAKAMGALVGRLHGLALPWSSRFALQNRPRTTTWADLSAVAQEHRAPWSGVLAEHLTTIEQLVVDASSAVASSGRPEVGSHRDLNAHNVLFSAGCIRLIDWDAAGPQDPTWERSDAATLWSARDDGSYDLEATVAFLRGYRDAGGELSADDPDVLVGIIGDVESWTRKCVRWALDRDTHAQHQQAEESLGALVRVHSIVAERQALLAEALRRLG